MNITDDREMFEFMYAFSREACVCLKCRPLVDGRENNGIRTKQRGLKKEGVFILMWCCPCKVVVAAGSKRKLYVMNPAKMIQSTCSAACLGYLSPELEASSFFDWINSHVNTRWRSLKCVVIQTLLSMLRRGRLSTREIQHQGS